MNTTTPDADHSAETGPAAAGSDSAADAGQQTSTRPPGTGSGDSGRDATGADVNSGSGKTSGVGQRPLYRPTDDRMLAGVASGLARFLGVDVLIVRIVIVVLCFVGGAGLPLYLASWLLIPDEGAEQSIAADFIGSVQSWRI